MYRILTLNGGGIRGYLTLKVLAHLEKESGKKISDMFDLVVGTSSGALVGALLDTLPASYIYGTLKSSYRQRLFKYNWFSLGGLLYTKYSNTSKEELIDEIIGTKVIKNFNYAAISYDIRSNRPVIFNNIEQDNNYKYLMTTDYPVSDAVKASSAAPLYWKPYILDNMTLVDGALVGNDPTHVAIKLALDGNHKLEDLCIVNITTGLNTRDYDLKSGLFPLKWTVPLADMLISSQANATSMLYTNEGLNYYNLDVPLTRASDSIDDTSDKNLRNLDLDGDDLINKSKNTIEQIIKDLNK